MAAAETEFEMVQRHVLQGEMHVARQLEIIAEMKLRMRSTGLAERLLFNFERSLCAHRGHLSELFEDDPLQA